MTLRGAWLAGAAALVSAAAAHAEFAGPNAVPNQIESDREQTLLGRGIQFGEDWDAWKSELQSNYGFGLGGDYTGVWLSASDSVPGGRDSTGAGIARIFGSWDLVGRGGPNTGSFIWKFEHRHGYANPAPARLWAITEVGYLGLFNPPFNDDFCPERKVTRGEMAAFLVRTLDLTDDGDREWFTDTGDSVFEADINRLATAGITAGCNPPANDQYCPEAVVSREQMAAFLVRGLGLTDPGTGDLFTDDDKSIFETDIDILATAGITVGCNPPAYDRFCPKDHVGRDQMASFLARSVALLGSQ